MTLAEFDKNLITSLEDTQIHFHDAVFRSRAPKSFQHTLFRELEIFIVAKSISFVDDGLACVFCTFFHDEKSGNPGFVNACLLLQFWAQK
jgi:hypothetical protein